MNDTNIFNYVIPARAGPSTANLIAIAKLYGVSAEELLKEVE